jgi:hypothetical protein
MGHIVPKVGDWVSCSGRESHGKVTQVSGNKFKAYFFGEPNGDGTSSIEGDFEWIEMKNIEGIVSDPNQLNILEKELSGAICAVCY